MAKQTNLKRTYRKLSAKEDAAMQRKIEQAEREAPTMKRELRQWRDEYQRLQDLIQAIAAEQSRQRVTLNELARRAEMDASNLSRLLRDPSANPTVQTVQRLAHALGKNVRIELVDQAA